MLSLIASFLNSTAADIRVTNLDLAASGRITIQSQGDPGDEHILLRGLTVLDVNTPIETNVVAMDGTATFSTEATQPSYFYRVVRLRSAPFTTILESSPANGESGVSVNRETIIRFTAPLAPNTTITTDQFFAGFGGRKLLSRVELSSDRTTATLFYLEPIPGSTRIYGAFDGAGLADYLGRPIDADGDGIAGGIYQFSFDTLSSTPVPGTAVIGRVFASEPVSSLPGEVAGLPVSQLSAFAQRQLAPNATGFINRPLAGVTITVDGAEESIRTTTDEEGRFVLNNVPAGRFFVHVDGRTSTSGIENGQLSWSQRDYYPVVGKAWEAVAGRVDNLAGGSGEIYLPLVRSGTLQPVSSSQETTVTFPPSVLDEHPDLAGVELTIPPNTLFSENGVRGGKVGIAPVPPDRLPEPLSPGLSFPIVITIQTDGPQNFDRPIPVRFPNLPDPATGKSLPPGAKTGLWSFNHDTGRWELQGSMTISEDGKYAVSDPGVGVRQPGWHGTNPSTPTDGGPPPPPPPDGCKTPPCCETPPCCPFVPQSRGDVEKFAFMCKALAAAGVFGGILLNETASNLCDRLPWPLSSYCNDQLPDTVKKAIMDGDACGKKADKCRDDFMDQQTGPVPGQNGPIILHSAKQGLAVTDSQFESDPNYISFSLRYERLVSKLDQLKPYTDTLSEILAAAEGQIELSDVQKLRIEAARAGIRSIIGEVSVTDFLLQQLSELNQQGAELTKTYFPRTSPLYFCIVDRDSGSIQRGRTSSSGAIDSLILAPERAYEIFWLFPETGEVIQGAFFSASAGIRTLIPPGGFRVQSSDSDLDGLSDIAEFVVGTGVQNTDTDSDGIADGVEVTQGTDPVSGIPVRTGIIASSSTVAPAKDIATANDLAVTANGAGGITLFNIANPFNPVSIGHVDTPGNAVRVAISDNDFVAVADEHAGLAIVDVRDPSSARIIHQLPFFHSVQAVDAGGAIAYAGLKSGQVVAVDLAIGKRLMQIRLPSPVTDLRLAGDIVCVLTESGNLHLLSTESGSFQQLGTVTIETESVRRLSVGGGIAYVTHSFGVAAIDLSTPNLPRFSPERSISRLGWLQMISSGSGLGLGTFVFNEAVGGSDLSLYDLGEGTTPPQLITLLPTPGLAYSVAIHNGLAYVADGSAGLQVVNYKSFDTQRTPPTIRLAANFAIRGTTGLAEEGKSVRVEALVTDDVQVRNVEFYLDNKRIATDGNFPFEVRFTTPLISAQTSDFTIQAKATDTGGNFTWTDEIRVTLVPDATPPRVLQTTPVQSEIAGSVENLAIYFNEPLAAASVSSQNVRLTSTGPDGFHETGDDFLIPGTVSYRSDLKAVFVTFSENLAPGAYSGLVTPGVRDLAGNSLSAEFSWNFWVLGRHDTDADGIPDDIETALGYDPANPDTNNNGTLDGAEDMDGDGLFNSWELLSGYDPRKQDSDSNGTSDAQEDPDQDVLTNLQELPLGTHPKKADSDGDRWDDKTEHESGSDPLNPRVTPKMLMVSKPPAVSVLFYGASPSESFTLGTVVANPPNIDVIVIGKPESETFTLGPVVAVPPKVDVLICGGTSSETFTLGPVVAKPPTVDILIYGQPEAEGFTLGPVVAKPANIDVLIFGKIESEPLTLGPVVALPPLSVDTADESAGAGSP